MDTRDTPEQDELRRSAGRLVRELGPGAVADLDDATRAKRLAGAVHDAGWLDLRDDAGDGGPLGSGVEAAIVADTLAAGVADAAFTGPVLAADLARRAGSGPAGGAVVACSADLVDAAVVPGPLTTTGLYAVDGATDDGGLAYVLVPDGDGHRLAQVRVHGAAGGADLTRRVRAIPPGTPVLELADRSRALTDDDLASWSALGLALTAADLVGAMRGVLDVSVAYAQEREQYGAPIGSFQAVQHLLAEARCLVEGARSVAQHAAWAVDDASPHEAVAAGRVAKAYCARAARTVTETAVQVHGGIGNTWECIVHVYLRRTVLSSRWFGDDGFQLLQIGRDRLGVADGLP